MIEVPKEIVVSMVNGCYYFRCGDTSVKLEHINNSLQLGKIIRGVLEDSENVEEQASDKVFESNKYEHPTNTQEETEEVEPDKPNSSVTNNGDEGGNTTDSNNPPITPSEKEIEDYIKSQNRYVFSNTQIMEELCGVNFDNYEDIVDESEYRSIYNKINNITKIVKKRIENEESGEWSHFQTKRNGKKRHYWYFIRHSEPNKSNLGGFQPNQVNNND